MNTKMKSLFDRRLDRFANKRYHKDFDMLSQFEKDIILSIIKD